MSDHWSGPRATAQPVMDISDFYAFPSPERPGNFVLVMLVFPFAPPSALFSEAVDYRFRLRPVRVVSTGGRAAFAVGDEERVLSVTFGAPQPVEGSDRPTQTGTCTGPSGEAVSFRVGDETGAQSNGLRVFAGCRLDAFFIDQRLLGAMRQTRRLPTEEFGRNDLDGQNALAIVVEGEVATLFGAGAGPMFAVVAETTTTDSLRVRLERVGRPEIKNFIMLDKGADAVNRDLEIRDLYNDEDAFNLRPDYLGAYRARFNGNLMFYDGLDGKTDWPLDAQGNHPLTELLMPDFLVVDVSKPFAQDGYLEIERALLRGAVHETCGGRWLDDDMVNGFLTLMINNGNGPRISDGVAEATLAASRTFPYLQRPNPNPPGRPVPVLPSTGTAC